MPARRLEVSTPAARRKGRLQEGADADLVVFDPEQVQDTSTYKDPHHYPHGIPYVLVNGVVVINQGQHTGAKAGKGLKNAESLNR